MKLKLVTSLSAVLLLLSGCTPSEPAETTTPSEEPPSSEITLTSPTEGSLASSPITVEGEAPGTWFFEAQTTIELQDANGNTLFESNIGTSDEWMTEDLVTFRGTYTYNVSEDQTGTLILHKANASGLPENDDQHEWTIELSADGISLDRDVESEQLGIALSMPKTFTLNKNADLMNLSYWGDTQERDTELFDGLSITFESMGTLSDNEQDSLMDFAQAQYDEAATSPVTESITDEVTSAQLGNNIDAYTYTVTSLGESDVYFFLNRSFEIIRVSVMAPDPGESGFAGWAELILGSIELI